MASDLSSQTIAFIGGGNMASAIISGLVSKSFAAHKTAIHVSEPWDVNRDKIAALGVRTTTSNAEAAAGANILILAVKPQVAKDVCTELASTFQSPLPLIVSIAAGITVSSLRKWCTTPSGAAPPVVRVMPNTPALLGEGASGVYAGEGVSEEQKALVTALLDSVSKVTEWVDKEELLDAVTAVSGSGPAYFFALVEHLAAAGVALGLSEAQATRLAAQTCLGAGQMMVTDEKTSPAQLRRNVTSPKGTTEAAIKSFESSGFAEIVTKAVNAAAARGEELGRTLGEM
ncbi:hypothetical protein N0V93_002410 [Gnomoniopsis smithogilvyi]|uniref:Pyrroline-5-carboxylate reductase n=1 Tax=Gnomoniopsis smithogilvyi TaxID=1191159 RepID=A0A9W8YYK3_9PEZI|nr:hypothetical protein N0V93_002410 [Gnomoniopsis smithogilvyi]